MAHRTDQPHQQPTPVADDIHATSAELLARSAHDYETAQNRRDELSREDRLHGNERA
jgi:hypothetical protein